ncbi:agamous-like mads-box protein agl103 [Quercus suber]|uniref:Agamous-like mads-box protein agl103 n=1 Tax=Quercus suber TaxID=58331 RepID=A0AAW0KYS9_QUESU
MELSALCDIPVCVISYDAAEGADGKAETWPECRDDVKALIHDYKNYHGVHRKFSLVNKKKGYKEIKKKDVDSSHKHKPEEFKRVLAMWKAWLNEQQHDEKSLESFWTFFDSMLLYWFSDLTIETFLEVALVDLRSSSLTSDWLCQVIHHMPFSK